MLRVEGLRGKRGWKVRLQTLLLGKIQDNVTILLGRDIFVGLESAVIDRVALLLREGRHLRLLGEVSVSEQGKVMGKPSS